MSHLESKSVIPTSKLLSGNWTNVAIYRRCIFNLNQFASSSETIDVKTEPWVDIRCGLLNVCRASAGSYSEFVCISSKIYLLVTKPLTKFLRFRRNSNPILKKNSHGENTVVNAGTNFQRFAYITHMRDHRTSIAIVELIIDND